MTVKRNPIQAKVLTKMQSQVLDFIRNFQAVNGCPPTRQEISDKFKWKSTNAAQQHLVLMSMKGYIKFAKRSTRNIVVCDV